MLDIPTLETERLILRPWDIARDAADVYAYASLPEATEYMCFDTHRSIVDSEGFLMNCVSSPEHAYAVTLRDGGSVIGGCGINPLQSHRRAEIGYILHPGHWGRGYASELAARLIRYGFEILCLNRIIARADVRNRASTRVMEKAGMSHEGTLREDMVIRGKLCSFHIYAILRAEWTARQEPASRPAGNLVEVE